MRVNRLARLEALLQEQAVGLDSSLDPAARKVIAIARRLQERSVELQTPQEKRQQAELDRMIQNPGDKMTLVRMTDEAFRSGSMSREADQLVHILDAQGIPRFFSRLEQALLKGFQSFGAYLPGVAMPMVKERMRRETANVILPADREHLAKHLERRREGGLRMNVNFLGEALLDEIEAERRMKHYLEALEWPEIEVISVKISTIYSRINPLAREHTLKVLGDRLERIYRKAMDERFVDGGGGERPKFVYLDMEEYRDLYITAETFMETLDRPGLERTRAGIALQAYIPDSFAVQKRLNEWARRRVKDGGAPVTIRLVKGANMEAERVIASVAGWPAAPFQRKIETDANFKRMLIEGLREENIQAVRLGIGSHNLFDVTYALVQAVELGVLDRLQFEMLEGMANSQRRALHEAIEDVLLYAPACRKKDFVNAIGYLVRRLDENTGPDNFLRHAFRIEVGSPDWKRLESGFIESFGEIERLPATTRRTQDRNQPVNQTPDMGEVWHRFVNEPHTDFALPRNVDWAKGIVRRWEARCDANAIDVPLVIAGREIHEEREMVKSMDPSRPGVCVGRYRLAAVADIDDAVACARRDEDGWRELGASARSVALRNAAMELRKAWGDLIGAAMADGGKTIPEADAEVAEAIDFTEFYNLAAKYFHSLDTLSARGKGVVVVAPPWNFPIAIPCGGIAAALAGGNNVIIKPAPETTIVAWMVCECFWRAGVSRRTLQFAPADEREAGTYLVTHPGVDAVVLTGGTETARHFLRMKPGMRLLAETGGKNATIVTALSDRDLAIRNVLHSAFSHSGQKCSATSLLILEGEVYDDPEFKRMLSDAVRSLEVGSVWDLKTRMGPLIRPPEGPLKQALENLEEEESWAVEPQRSPDNPRLVSPGIRWGVRPESFTHRTELFGPILSVMRAPDLRTAVRWVNATGYGLTSGIETLDEREQEYWRDRIRAGNLYINRATTGAIVLRQPFGGFGKSSFGPGIKAGGPNYVAQLMDFNEERLPQTNQDHSDPLLAEMESWLSTQLETKGLIDAATTRRVLAGIGSAERWKREEFGATHDHFRLVGQDNLRRYLPVKELRIRMAAGDSPADILLRVCMARAAGCRQTLSLPEEYRSQVTDWLEVRTHNWGALLEVVEESDDELAELMRHGATDRVRYASPDRVPEIVRKAAGESGVFIADADVVCEARVELLWYFEEQSISHDYHRYGNLGGRSGEERAAVL